ncbi:MAG: hypothetical protein R2733_08565 [Acidimicrobiales bacterium]
MFTWGSKFLFAISLVALISACVYGLVTGGQPVGVISAGYKGGVGEHLGYTILVFASVSALVLGTVAVIARDGDAEAMAQLAGTGTVPAVTPPADPAIWGLLSAFALASVIVGAAVSRAFLYLGIAVFAVVLIQWLVQAWSDRATGDPEVNRIIRRRVIGPIEVPLMGTVGIAVIVLGVSRIFLAAPSQTWSVVAGSVITIVLFGSAVLLSKVQVPKSVSTALMVLGAVVVLAGGIVGAAVGERDFHHGTEHHEEAE